MNPPGEADTLTVLVVDAPATFEDRVRIALPEALVTSTDRHGALLRTEGAPIVVLYQRNPLDDRSLAEFAHLVRTIVVAERADTTEAVVSLECGAEGYLDAAIGQSALRSALLGVASGELAYGRDLFGKWLRARRFEPRTAVELTPRQRQIIDLIADGASDKEIAAAIGVRTATAQKHVARLLRRLGVRNRAAAVAAHRPLRPSARVTD
jgi:DNA-binding NarL/FixJ family response regulator